MSGGPVVLKGTELMLNTVSGHGTATVLHVAQCRTCRASSDLGQDEVRPAAVWAVQHTRAHSDHRHFWLTSRQRWRVDRNTAPATPFVPDGTDASDGATVPVPPAAPAGAQEGEDAPPHGGRSRHASPRPTRRTRLPVQLRRARNAVARLAGPLYLTGMCGAIGAVLVAAHAMGKS